MDWKVLSPSFHTWYYGIVHEKMTSSSCVYSALGLTVLTLATKENKWEERYQGQREIEQEMRGREAREMRKELDQWKQGGSQWP